MIIYMQILWINGQMTTSMLDYNKTHDDIGNDIDLVKLQGNTSNLSNHEVNDMTIIQSSIIKYQGFEFPWPSLWYVCKDDGQQHNHGEKVWKAKHVITTRGPLIAPTHK